jgi:SNF2 family DNA or RNA helicase
VVLMGEVAGTRSTPYQVRVVIQRDGEGVDIYSACTCPVGMDCKHEAPVFLISLKAGGVALTLTEADYVFLLDPWWNPAVEAQAVDRTHRIGQQRTVMVYRLVAADTIEQKVMELKERKAALFAQVIDGDGAMTADITADDVRAIFEA